MLIAAVVVLVPLILHFWDSELFRRRQFAMKQVLSVLDDHSVLGAPQNMQGLEEMLRERAEGRDSCFSLYRIESDDVYIILLVPRPLMGEDSPYPVVYLSKDKLEALERLQPEKLN
jgi:hypothetical protein